MAKKFKKVISAFLTLVLCISAMNLTVFAEEENTVQAHQKSHLLGAAENDLATFNFKVVEEYIPEARDSRYAVVGAGEQTEFWTAFLYTTPSEENPNEAPMVTINGQDYYLRSGGRDINGIYLDGNFYPESEISSGKNLQAAYNGLQQALLMNGSGKKVAVYCADHVTPTTTEARYTVVNIEDATHYDKETAGKIRAVAANGYWGGIKEVDQYGTLQKMKDMMKSSGEFTQEEIDLLSPGVALSATQFALWELANEDDDRQVVNVQYIVKNRVAGYNGKTWNTLKITPAEEIPCVDLIFKLSNYLTSLKPIAHTEMTTGNTVLTNKVILNDVDINVLYKAIGHSNNQDEDKNNDAYVTDVIFDMLPVSEKDNLTAKIVDENNNVYAIGRICGALQEGEVQLINNGNGTYTFPGITLVENQETTYTVVVEGVQHLERNVYLYTAGERGTSQTLIGYDEGEYTIDVTSSVKKTFNFDDPTVSFKHGEASNISFMLIDKTTGNVEFIEKIDIGNETSFEIPFEAGKVSAVFVKQSTSGMFWFSEKVDENLVNATIGCLKANNPSYKGHNAVVFGAGEHTLEFKKNKFATYTFAGCNVVNDNKVEVNVTEEPVVEPTEEPTEEPTVDTTPEPTLNVAVKGADVASWTIKDDVTAIYIAANGKVPAVVWTSEVVDDKATMDALIEALGADADAKTVSGLGAHKIEYQHNKNKTKTVTYTFE